MSGPAVLAHVAPGHQWLHLGGEPQVVLALVALTAGYVVAERRRRRRPVGTARLEPVLFGAGVVLLAVALLSPLDGLAGSLFAAHMAQHVALTTLAPPLLLLGHPGRRLLRLLPGPALTPTVAGLHRRARRLRMLGGAGTAVAAAVAVHVLVLWSWHVPVLYEAAVRRPALHGLEHLSLLGSALWFWAEVMRLHRRAAHAYALLGLFLVGAAGAALGVLLAFSGRVAYGVHAAGAAEWGLTALEDQQIAAVGMWMGGGLVYVAAAVVLATRWLAAGAGHGRLPAAAPAVALLLLMAGCGDGPLSPPAALPQGNPELGRARIVRYGCGSCHMIPGIRQADSGVAPPLVAWSERAFIGGRLANTPANLIRWIRDPQAVDPGSPMPDLDVTDADARHIAAYLLTLRGG